MSRSESIVEDAALEWFLLRQGFRRRRAFGGQVGGQVGELGYAFGRGPQLAPGELAASRATRLGSADEAHRSQYGVGPKVNEKTGEMPYGFASNLRDALPNASFIGFTGMPIEKTDANTRAAGEMQNDEFQMSNRLNFAILHSHFPRRWWAVRNASRSSPPIW